MIDLDELAGPNGGDEGRRLAKHWLDQVNSVRDHPEYKRWLKRGTSIERRYRDERNRTDEDNQRRYNALWANTEILRPALYGRVPLPIAERRFRDKDPTGRFAAQILERALRNEIEICGFNEALQRAVSDYLLPGRGTIWVRYEPEIQESVSLPVESEIDLRDEQGEIESEDQVEEDQEDNFTVTPGNRKRMMLNEDQPEGEGEEEDKELSEEKLEDTGDRILRESTPIDFIPWLDFYTFPARARTWTEVIAVGKRVYLSRDQMKKRFGSEIGKGVPMRRDKREGSAPAAALSRNEGEKCEVFEIWSRHDETVYWVAEGYEYLCDRKDDPLRLEKFFPCPPPLYANPTNNTLVPVPDYIQYQDQAIQIDELTQRIAMLTKACKVAGVYNAAATAIKRIFDESLENELIPVDDWAAFGGKGGVAGNISLLPLKEIIGVLNELMVIKQSQIEEMDRLTGINDIMRGTSDARETLGGVRLKANSSGTRLTSRQNEVARFARDTLRIMADIMAEHFSPQSLIEASGALYEEGLGPEDMPPLTELMAPATMGAPPSTPGQGGPPGAPPGQPPQPMPPTGTNVVPFRPPGPPAPMQQPPMGGMPPQMPQGMPPGPPQMPQGAPNQPGAPSIMAKFAALQRIAKGIALLRDEKLRGFRVDIEVDSTIYADQAQEKSDRSEFIGAITGYLKSAMEMGAQMPEAIPLLGKLLQFGARGFRVGRDLETAIEEFTDEAIVVAKKRLAEAANQPNPMQQKMQLDTMKVQSQISAAKIKSDSEAKAGEAEVQRQQIENQGELQNSQADLAAKQIDLQMRMIEKRIEEMRMQVELIKAQREINQPEQSPMPEKKAGPG